MASMADVATFIADFPDVIEGARYGNRTWFVHGKAFACSVHLASAVLIERGETEVFTLRTAPRTKCKRCGTYVFAEVPGSVVRGVNADLLPEGTFSPEFHIHCRYAKAAIEDDLPHYKDTPARFNGSDELMQW